MLEWLNATSALELAELVPLNPVLGILENLVPLRSLRKYNSNRSAPSSFHVSSKLVPLLKTVKVNYC